MNRKQFFKSAFSGFAGIFLGDLNSKLQNIYLPFVQKNNVRYIRDSRSFTSILTDASVQPGEVIILADGVYTGDFTSHNLFGTEEYPIIFRPENPGNVIIDGSLYFGNTAWVHFYDIDFMDSRTDRSISTVGIKGYFEGFGLYGCLIHDLHSSGVNWYGSGAGEIAECVFYNNGYFAADGSGHGHSIYSFNDLGGRRSIARNIFHDELGRYSIHLYDGSEKYIKDFTCEDNIIVSEAVHTGGGLGLIDFIYQGNVQYGKWCQHGRYTQLESQGYHNLRGQIHNNEFIDLGSYTVNQGNNLPWEELTETVNIFYQASYPATYIPVDPSGYILAGKPATKVWLTPFMKSQRWLGSLALYNRDSVASVSVDFSPLLPSGNFKLRNTQNRTETWDFVFTGAPINVPLTNWTPATRIGDGLPNTGLPIFAAFVIERQ